MNTFTFTPRLRGGQRLDLQLSLEDIRKIGQGRGWKATVTDVPTGVTYDVKAAACSLHCYCDALVTRIHEP